jgi:hypothetical protein
MMLIRKTIQSFKDVTDKGTVLAVFSTLGVIDKDGDITLPGFIGSQHVAMLPTHDWKHVPIGKGTTRESGDQVLAELKMNLEIPSAKDWLSAIKFDLENGEPLQEYSYGFTIQDGGASEGGQDASGAKAYRTLRPTPEGKAGCIVHEVSPVLVGAGENTRTLAAKGAKFGDELEMALAAIDGLVIRAKSLADLRAKDGRGLSAVNVERIKSLRERIKLADGSISPLLQDDDARNEAHKAARVELRRFLKNQAGI